MAPGQVSWRGSDPVVCERPMPSIGKTTLTDRIGIVRETLRQIAELLRENGHLELAVIVEDAIAGYDRTLDTFLASNDLWGGSGSIADSGGSTRTGERRNERRESKMLSLRLAKNRYAWGKVNPRTSMWVTAFSKWKASGI